jgi:hypothetical protein
MGQRCKICSHTSVRNINSAIRKGRSLRAIGVQFGISHTTVQRHTNECLSLELQALIQQNKLEQAVNVHEEFLENLVFAKDLRLAARKWLTVNDEIDLDPRASEVLVIYDDLLDVTAKGQPKTKKEKLHVLLETATVKGAVRPDYAIIKTMDNRKFALEAIGAADSCVDKFAKLGGLYAKDKENPQDAELAKLKAKIEARASEKGIGYDEELRNYLERYADDVRPEIKEQLASELIQ